MDANKLVFLNVRLAIFRADPCGKRVPFFPALRPAQDGNPRWNGVFFFFGWGGGILTTFRENEVESLKKNANTVTRRCH